jgi:hypothetical protein
MNSLVTHNSYDFSKSNLILMVGGQILILVIILMIVFFGTDPIKAPVNTLGKIINKNVLSSANSK